MSGLVTHDRGMIRAFFPGVLLCLIVLRQGLLAEDSSPSPGGKSSALKAISEALNTEPQLEERFYDQNVQEKKDVFGDFVQEQHLSAQQAQDFYKLLADSAVDDFLAGLQFVQNGGKETEENATARSKRGAALDQKMQLLLGDVGMAHLAQYQKTESERLTLAQYRYELRRVDVSLSDATRKALFHVIVEERAHSQPTAFAPRDSSSTEQLGKSLEGDNAQRYYAAEADLNRRILERVGAILSEDQYRELAKFFDRHLATEKAGTEAMRKATQPPPK